MLKVEVKKRVDAGAKTTFRPGRTYRPGFTLVSSNYVSHAFDLHKHVPYHNATENFRELIFDDRLYLTAEGYDLVGNVVTDHLIPLLSSRDSGEE